MNKAEFVIEPGRQDIVITRMFDAPRELVFRAMTDPELIPSWWGPRKYKTIVDEAEIRPGGRWRFLNRDDEGNEYAFKGVYHDIDAPGRVVWTFEFEGAPGHVSLETMTLEEVDGKTKFVTVAVYQSVADRDAMVASGMQEGAMETYDRLEEVVSNLK
ncbi:MAG: SRPBCC family protein [Longispora sp.]|nr:SRPBCC family protein [Longispora sp. (in: high G+C Gram-positive bacteria)]